jgi:hypothetical protein
VFYVKLFCFEVKFATARNKSTMHIWVTLYSGYLNVLRLFLLVCILSCGCFNLFCNECVCVYVYVCVWQCVGVFVIHVLVFTVFCNVCTVLLYCFVYVYFILICFICTSVMTTATV